MPIEELRCVQVCVCVCVCVCTVASTVLHIWRPDGLLVSFSVMAYSFTAHPYYLGIYNNLATATPTRMLRVTDLVRDTHIHTHTPFLTLIPCCLVLPMYAILLNTGAVCVCVCACSPCCSPLVCTGSWVPVGTLLSGGVLQVTCYVTLVAHIIR